jgi:hypothetical protein
VLERLAALRSPGLTGLMRGLTGLLGSIWTSVEAPFRHARFDVVLQPAELAGDG